MFGHVQRVDSTEFTAAIHSDIVAMFTVSVESSVSAGFTVRLSGIVS